MSDFHHIGDLLLNGAIPTVEEAAHLTDLGAFVAGRFGRYLHGLQSPSEMGAHAGDFAANVSARLGASTGTRWGQGMGIADALFGSEWASWWQVASTGFAEGYQRFDVDRPVLGLYEDAPKVGVAPSPVVEGRPRRGSLFGRRSQRMVRSRPGKTAGAKGRSDFTFANGESIALQALNALEVGGLELADQFADDLGIMHQDGAAHQPQSASRRRPNGASAFRSVSMDGLVVDRRTPALSSALEWAEAAFGDVPVRGGGLSVSMAAIDRLAPNARAGISPRSSGGARPVFAFFDAVEGDFLNLTSETAPVAAQQAAQVEAQSLHPSRRISFANSGSPAASRRLGAQNLGSVTTSLATVAPAGTTTTPLVRPFVQGVFPEPVSAAAAATTTLGRDLATSVTYTGQGLPQARVQRASMSTPRLRTIGLDIAPPRGRTVRQVPATKDAAASNSSLVQAVGTAPRAMSAFMAGASVASDGGVGPTPGVSEVAAPWAEAQGASTRWVSVLGRGATMPLGSTLTRAERSGAEAVLANAPSMVQSVTPFAPVVARAFGAASPGFGGRDFTAAIDGVVWVSPEHAGSEPTDGTIGLASQYATAHMGLVAVPSNVRSVQVPASEVVQHGVIAGATALRRERLAMVGAAGLNDISPSQPGATASPSSTNRTHMGRAVDAYLSAGVLPSWAGLRDVAMMPFSAMNSAEADDSVDAAFVGGAALGEIASSPSSVFEGGAGTTAAVGAAPITRMDRMVARWSELTGASDQGQHSIGRGFDLGTTTYSYGAGAYSALAADRRMLALSDDEAAAAVTSGAEGAGPVPERVVPSMFESVAGPLSLGATGMGLAASVAVGSVGAAEGLGLSERGEQFVSGAGVAAALVSRSTMQGAVTGSIRGEDFVPAAVAAGRLRQSLLRPVTTPTEARVAAASLDQVLRTASVGAPGRGLVATSRSGAIGRMASSAHRALGAGHARAVLMGAEPASVQPRLGSAVRARLNRRFAEMGLNTAQTSGVTELARTLGSMDSVERRAVMQTLQRSGWTEPELRMLSMVPAETSSDAGETGTAAQAGVSRGAQPTGMSLGGRDVLGAASADPTVYARRASSVRRMTRNLARVVSGAEGVASYGVSGVMPGTDVDTLTAGLAGIDLPMLAGLGGDSYFGSLGVGAARVSGRSSYSLRDAVGELLAVAREMVADSDSATSATARSESLRRVARVRNALGEGGVAGLGLGATEEMRQVIGLAEEVSLATGRGDSLSEQVALRAARAASARVDTSVLTTASDAPRPSLATLLGSFDRALLKQDHQPSGAGAQAAGSESGVAASLSKRLGEALGLSSRGPAGANRLLKTVHASVGVDGERTASMATDASSLAAGHQRELLGSSILDGAIAPEFMLGSIRSPEMAEATQTLESRRRWMRGDLTQVLAGAEAAEFGSPGAASGLGSAPQDEAAVQSAHQRSAAGVRRRGMPARLAQRAMTDRGFIGAEATIGTQASIGGQGAGEATSPRRRGGFAAGPLQVLLAMTQEKGIAAAGRQFGGQAEFGSIGQGLAGGGVVPEGAERSVVLKALLRGQGRKDVVSLFQKAGASDFAYAWLNRIDGSRSGLDLGLSEARAAVRKTFGSTTGRQRSRYAMAEQSPIASASLVSPVAASRKDSSGLRQLAGTVGGRRGGRVAGRHAAASAFQRTDWRFVQTGSQSATPHADLGKLASAIASSNESAGRAPMPLVAPAVKAVAQSALRAPSTEKRAASRSGSGPSGASKSKDRRASQPNTMSETGIEMLAIEMAARVSRILGLKQERIGVWQ